MATLATQQSLVTGVALTLNAAAGGGDKVSPGTVLIIRNGSGAPIVVTVVVPGNTEFGVAAPDYTFSVAAGGIAAIGPLPQKLADVATNLIDLTYSGVTTLTVSPISV